jgi:hypothetical protein
MADSVPVPQHYAVLVGDSGPPVVVQAPTEAILAEAIAARLPAMDLQYLHGFRGTRLEFLHDGLGGLALRRPDDGAILPIDVHPPTFSPLVDGDYRRATADLDDDDPDREDPDVRPSPHPDAGDELDAWGPDDE